MKKIIFLLAVFSVFFLASCSEDPKPVDKSGQLGEECKADSICEPGLACSVDNKCISKDEACQFITCSSSTDNNIHGTCIIEDNKAVCDCDENYVRTGYTGTKCEPSDVCLNIICSGKGTCYENTDGEPRCNCETGYIPIGTNCIKDTDRCASITCSDHGTCQVGNTGLLECACEAGYHSQGLNCISDSAPCDGVTCSDHGTCEVNGTDAYCNCDTGFIANGLECVDEATNPCKDQTCSGHGECQVHEDAAVCICSVGYVPGDNLDCVESGVDVCDNVTCSGHGLCVEDFDGNPECECETGYEAEALECVNVIPEECQVDDMCYDGPNGTLKGDCFLDETGQPKCDCYDGYFAVGFMCIEDMNSPCYEQTCSDNGTCKLDIVTDIPYCDCNEGYVSSETDNLSCLPLTDICNGVTCSGNGTCIDNGYGGITCDCIEGFINVGTECIVNPCIPNVCNFIDNTSSDKYCIAHSDGNYTCACDVGYYWDELSESCLLGDCENENMHPDGGSCVCDNGYIVSEIDPDFCDLESGDPCSPNICAGNLNSICSIDGLDVDCVCKDGYVLTGNGCVVEACAVNPCIEDNKNVCSKDGDSYKCLCNDGYVDNEGVCEISSATCNPNPCTEVHMVGCEDYYGDAICLCEDGWAGYNCDVECSLCVGMPNALSSASCILQDGGGYVGQVCDCESGFYFDRDTQSCISY